MHVTLNFARRVYRNTYLLRNMVSRDLKTRYIGSFLGMFWSVIHPMIQMALYFFIFSVILGIRQGEAYQGSGFAAWMICGLLPWIFFAEILTRAPMIVVSQANLIKKTPFPSEILPLPNVFSAIINHAIAMLIFISAMVGLGKIQSIAFLWFIPFMIVVSLFGMGLSWIFSALNVFLRDVAQLVGMSVQIWFFLTPIIYPIEKAPALFQTVSKFNLMVYAVEGYRAAILNPEKLVFADLGYFFLGALFVLSVGGVVFRKLKPAFVDVL